MYEQHFDLTAEPFDLVPNPAFLYMGAQYREAMAALQYGLVERRGFITLIGEVGTGKTTILFNLLADMPDGVEAAFVSYADQPFPGLLSLLLTDLSVPHDPASETGMLSALQGELLNRAETGRTVAFVIDVAQNLSDQTLERLRLLSNIETSDRKLLQMVLVGQPELQARLRQQHLRQLNERVSVRAHLRPLARAEMDHYVAHRLERVGGSLSGLFTPAARRLLFWGARGIPRRANILFHNALLFAFGRGERVVSSRVAWEAIRGMNDRPVRPAWLGVPAWVAAGLLAAVCGGVLLRFASLPPSSDAAGVAVEAPAAAPASDQEVPGVTGRRTSSGAVRADPVDVAAIDPVAAAPDTMAVRILPGATLKALARDVYGPDVSPGEFARLIDQILRLNPQVRDPNFILAGGSLKIPSAVPSSVESVGKP